MKIEPYFSEIWIAAVIAATVLFFFIYYYLAYSGFLKRAVIKTRKGIHQKLSLFLARKITGFLFMGLLPGIIYYSVKGKNAFNFGISFTSLSTYWPVILIVAAVIVLVLFINQKVNPSYSSLQFDTENWTFSLFMQNAVGWSLYLLAYEFLFRGILLFECNAAFGFWPAVAVNVAIYAAIHMVNGKAQTIGALIFGTLACYLTLWSGTILIPVFMHITLSVAADIFSILAKRKSPKMEKKVAEPWEKEVPEAERRF